MKKSQANNPMMSEGRDITAQTFQIVICLLLGALIMPAQESEPWYEQVLVGMEVGPTGAQFGGDIKDFEYARQFNGRDIVRRSVEAHSEYIVIWGRDGEFAYYDSKSQPKAPGLGDRDVLRETVEEARKHDLPVIVYCVLQYPSYDLRTHPDWKAADVEGKPINHLVCFNSPYREHIKQVLDEILAYDIDGFHLDMVDQGFGPPHGCWCPNCEELFRAEYGSEMPNGISWDESWDKMLAFRYQTSDRFERDLVAHIRKVAPQVTVDFNYHGNPPFSWEVGQRPVQHADNSDFVTGETGQWAFSALGIGLNAQFYRAAFPGKPYQVAIQRGVRQYHDQTTRPLNDIKWELFTLLSHGAFVTMIDKTAYDGWLDPVAYQRIGEAFSEALGRRAQFGQTPVYDVGLYFSSRSRDWYGRGDPPRYFQAFQGAHKACVYEHLSFGVLFDESLSLSNLQMFPVVCLPNAAILSAAEVGMFREYVEQGGQLLITGQSGVYDRMGNPRDQSALEDLIGAQLKRRLDSVDNWVRFASPADQEFRQIVEGIPLDWPFMVMGPASVYRPVTATALGELIRPHRSLLQRLGKETSGWPMSADAPVGPAVLLNRVGKGTVLTFAGSPDYAAADVHHITEARNLLANAIRFLHPKPRVRINAPASVETVVTDDPATRTLRVHFIAYNALPQTTPAKNRPFILPGLIEEAPLYRATITSATDLREASVLGKTTQLQRQGRRVQLTVEAIHEVVLLEY